jgi:hypothetical protein
MYVFEMSTHNLINDFVVIEFRDKQIFIFLICPPGSSMFQFYYQSDLGFLTRCVCKNINKGFPFSFPISNFALSYLFQDYYIVVSVVRPELDIEWSASLSQHLF